MILTVFDSHRLHPQIVASLLTSVHHQLIQHGHMPGTVTWDQKVQTDQYKSTTTVRNAQGPHPLFPPFTFKEKLSVMK